MKLASTEIATLYDNDQKKIATIVFTIALYSVTWPRASNHSNSQELQV